MKVERDPFKLYYVSCTIPLIPLLAKHASPSFILRPFQPSLLYSLSW